MLHSTSRPPVPLFRVFRHERDGLVNDETRRRMHLIVPHMRRAVLIGRVIDLKLPRPRRSPTPSTVSAPA